MVKITLITGIEDIEALKKWGKNVKLISPVVGRSESNTHKHARGEKNWFFRAVSTNVYWYLCPYLPYNLPDLSDCSSFMTSTMSHYE